MPRYAEFSEEFRRWLDNAGYTFSEPFYEAAETHNSYTQAQLAALDKDIGKMLVGL